jgi:hypothetical protein
MGQKSRANVSRETIPRPTKTVDFAALWRRFWRKDTWFRKQKACFWRAIFEAK